MITITQKINILSLWLILFGYLSIHLRAIEEIRYPGENFAKLDTFESLNLEDADKLFNKKDYKGACLLYTSPSPRDATLSRMPSSA